MIKEDIVTMLNNGELLFFKRSILSGVKDSIVRFSEVGFSTTKIFRLIMEFKKTSRGNLIVQPYVSNYGSSRLMQRYPNGQALQREYVDCPPDSLDNKEIITCEESSYIVKEDGLKLLPRKKEDNT